MTRYLFTIVFIVVMTMATYSQTTEFTFQGSLKDNAVAANGNYDFEFALFDLLAAGSQIGATIPKNNVVVTNGIFAVKLDFGSAFPGANRYLEVRVRLAGQPGITTLAPRQLLNSAPYSVKSLNTDSAATAGNALQLGGVAANQYVVTTDPRMTDARAPTAGSANYIQNGTLQQASSNFNISGNGIIGGNVGIGTTNPASKLHVFGKGVLRINADSDSNAGFGLSLNNQLKWSVATVNPGHFQIFNQALVSNALWIDNATNNVGIGTASPAATLEVNGYTKLGSDAPSIKVKKLTGTTAATEGAFVQIFHGLDSSKILSVSVMVEYFGSDWVGPSYIITNGFHFNWGLFGSYIGVYNAAGGSANLLSKPVKILIIYEQ